MKASQPASNHSQIHRNNNKHITINNGKRYTADDDHADEDDEDAANERVCQKGNQSFNNNMRKIHSMADGSLVEGMKLNNILFFFDNK